MDTTTSVIATGTLAAVGTWSEGKGITLRLVTGVIVLSIALALLSNVDAKLARGMAMLVLVTATFRYLPATVNKLGLKK